MNWASATTKFGLDGEGGFYLRFTDDCGEHIYLTVDRKCHVLVIPPNGPTQYGDDVTPYEAYYLLTGRRAEDVLNSINPKGIAMTTETVITPETTTETVLRLPSRFQIGDYVSVGSRIGQVRSVEFCETPIYYHIVYDDGDFATVNSIEVEPAPNVGDVIARMGVMESALNLLLPESHGGRAQSKAEGAE